MNVLDIRPSCNVCCDPDSYGYSLLRSGKLDAQVAARLLPDRATLGMIWRYLAGVSGPIEESAMCLCRKIVRWSNMPLSLEQLLTCLDIFCDVGLLQIQKLHKCIRIELIPCAQKADLQTSTTMQRLLQAKES